MRSFESKEDISSQNFNLNSKFLNFFTKFSFLEQPKKRIALIKIDKMGEKGVNNNYQSQIGRFNENESLKNLDLIFQEHVIEYVKELSDSQFTFSI